MPAWVKIVSTERELGSLAWNPVLLRAIQRTSKGKKDILINGRCFWWLCLTLALEKVSSFGLHRNTTKIVFGELFPSPPPLNLGQRFLQFMDSERKRNN